MSYRKTLIETKKYNHDRLEIRCANQRRTLAETNVKISNLYSEIKELKELLKECKCYVEDCVTETEENLLTRINAAIGESEE